MDILEAVVKEIGMKYPKSSLATILTAQNIEDITLMKETERKIDDDKSKEKNLKIYLSQNVSKNLGNSSKIQNVIVDYFSEFMAKNVLCGDEEIIFMELNEDMKIRIFEKLSGKLVY